MWPACEPWRRPCSARKKTTRAPCVGSGGHRCIVRSSHGTRHMPSSSHATQFQLSYLPMAYNNISEFRGFSYINQANLCWRVLGWCALAFRAGCDVKVHIFTCIVGSRPNPWHPINHSSMSKRYLKRPYMPAGSSILGALTLSGDHSLSLPTTHHNSLGGDGGGI